MRLVYFGTPAMAVPPLLALHEAGHEILLVVSRADTRRGRGSTVSPSPVKAAALELGLEVTDDPRAVLELDADLGVVVAYGRIISAELLAHLPMVNLHFSLLPRWRGAAPVERAILAGDERTGVCVMDVEQGLDTGGVHACIEIPLDDTVDAAALREQLVAAGTELLVDTLSAPLGAPTPQPEDGVTYAHKVSAEDLELHWDRPAAELHRVVRVGGARARFRSKLLKVLEAEQVEGATADGAVGADVLPGTFLTPTTVRTGDGVLRLVRVQPEGKAAMDAAAWANGARPTGEAFDS